MTEELTALGVPTPEKALRDLAKNVSKVLPRFAEEEPTASVKRLHGLLGPILETAELPVISPGHRAAASNALCAIIDACQASDAEYAREAILDDSIWLRVFNIYLQKSDEAKGKSMRQMLLVLTGSITKDQSPRALELRRQAASTFLDIICARQDRIKVKPALQGLAHFFLRDVVTIAQLLKIFRDISPKPTELVSMKDLFKAFLAWIVHHDTSLSAGHLIKNFLLQARKMSHHVVAGPCGSKIPIWIEPVVSMLHVWPDRMQEFKTHVFPHCFLPDIEEYLQFLAYLRFDTHVLLRGTLLDVLRTPSNLENGLSSDEEFQILLAALEAGKELTILRDNDYRSSTSVLVQNGAIYLPDDVLGEWAAHSRPEVRLAGMFLMVYSTSITRPLTGGIFKSLRRNLVHLHTDTDANYRREIHGYTQKLFDRLRASTATLSKNTAKTKGSESSRMPIPKSCFNVGTISLERSKQDPLLEPLAFIVWYTRFLVWELRPTASYQRRITALQSLVIVLRSGIDPGIPHSHLSKAAQGQLVWPYGMKIASPSLIRVLLDLILDPFDDVRNTAISVLQLCMLAFSDAEKEAVITSIPPFISRAETMMLQTGRADQADGVARAYSLLFSQLNQATGSSDGTQSTTGLDVSATLERQLAATLQVAHKNLSEAVDGRPVHGTFAALRYIVDTEQFYASVLGSSAKDLIRYKTLHDNIISSIESLWSCVYHILCADAPEGLVPDEVEEDAGLDTKEILSYSWRGLKEASVLLRTIVSKAPIGDGDSALLSVPAFERLGKLCFTQLLELRHRGAFSTVSQTFAAFCRRCISTNDSNIRALPEVWYQDTLNSIQAKADAITRRSAGIPALMAAIVAADPKMFPRTLKDLIAESLVEAQSMNIEESRLPQVHAMNCIKEFFTTSRLSGISEAYIGEGLELAAKTLNSNIWPIRNCSLMLFKALIERLLGSDEAQDWKDQARMKTSRFSYQNYPALVDMLSSLLDSDGPLKQSIEEAPSGGSPLDLHGAEGVFPALQILRQARPPDDSLESIVAAVEKLLGSPHWHLRDMAARTVMSLRPRSQLYNAALGLLKTGHGSQNTQHGSLLATKYLLRKLLRDPDDLGLEQFETLMKELTIAARKWYTPSHCPFIRSALLDIVSICGLALLSKPDAAMILPTWEKLTQSVEIGPEYALRSRSRASNALLQQSLARVYFIDRVILRNGALGSMVFEEYQSIGEALVDLANNDPDTCCAALDTLDQILRIEPANNTTIPLELILAHVHTVILTSDDAEVLSKAQSTLADGLERSNLRRGFFGLGTEEQILSTLAKLEAQCLSSPPSNTQTALHLFGFFLDHAYHTYPAQHETTLAITARYIRLLRTLKNDNNPFDTRFAVIQSLSALQHIWTAPTTQRETSLLILSLALLLHDLLNDDDDQIRALAALTTGTLLGAQRSPHTTNTVPLLSTHRLATWLPSAFPTSHCLVTHALRRLTACSAPAPLFSQPFEAQMQNARHTDTALFATEKQNLYRDASLDARLWSRILCALPPSRARNTYHAQLAAWVCDGLRVLSATAARERDGALGWASMPDVFALGVRLVCAAEVVVRWGGEARSEVLRGLRGCADGLDRAEGHGLLVEGVEGVVEREVVRVLGRTGVWMVSMSREMV